MKKFLYIIPLVLSMIIVINLSSCFIFLKGDRGHHYGWYKPHHHRDPVIIISPHRHGHGHGHGHHK